MHGSWADLLPATAEIEWQDKLVDDWVQALREESR